MSAPLFLSSDHMSDCEDYSCLYSVIVMHRRTDLWGPDGIINFGDVIGLTHSPYFLALVFDPDRFLDERLQKYLIPNPYIFCPFNAGPRICLGQQVRKTTHSCSQYDKLNKNK